MMNADTIAKRNIRPLESSPVRCVDFERRFWGKFGMAEIKERQGAEFHAVLHSVTSEDMAELDRMERGYVRVGPLGSLSSHHGRTLEVPPSSPSPPSPSSIPVRAEGPSGFKYG